MTQRPEMNRKVDVMIALGPTVRMSSSLRKMLPYARDPRVNIILQTSFNNNLGNVCIRHHYIISKRL